MKIKKENLRCGLFGILIGVINGLLGSGGGMMAVPLLRRAGLNQKQAQANAIAVILPISVVSAVMYLFQGNVAFGDAWEFLPGGVAGALIGTFFLSKISSRVLSKTFAAFMLWAGLRLLLR